MKSREASPELLFYHAQAIKQQYSLDGHSLRERMIIPFKFDSTEGYIQARVINDEISAAKGWVVGLLGGDDEEKQVSIRL